MLFYWFFDANSSIVSNKMFKYMSIIRIKCNICGTKNAHTNDLTIIKIKALILNADNNIS